MRPSSAKAKGRRLQNEVAKLIQEVFGLPESDVRPAVMGESGCDIKLSAHALEAFPFAVECKNQESLNVWAALEQAAEHARQGFNSQVPPLLIFKRNRTETFCAMPLGNLLQLLRKIQVLKAASNDVYVLDAPPADA